MAIVREENVFDRLRDFFTNVINGDKKKSNAESRSSRSPLTISWDDERWLLTLTQNLRLARTFFINLRRLPFSCQLWRIVKTLFFHTVSYVFLMSRAIAMRCCLFLYGEQMLVCIEVNASSVEWLSLKPHCSLLRRDLDSNIQIRRR